MHSNETIEIQLFFSYSKTSLEQNSCIYIFSLSYTDEGHSWDIFCEYEDFCVTVDKR